MLEVQIHIRAPFSAISYLKLFPWYIKNELQQRCFVFASLLDLSLDSPNNEHSVSVVTNTRLYSS